MVKKSGISFAMKMMRPGHGGRMQCRPGSNEDDEKQKLRRRILASYMALSKEVAVQLSGCLGKQWILCPHKHSNTVYVIIWLDAGKPTEAFFIHLSDNTIEHLPNTCSTLWNEDTAISETDKISVLVEVAEQLTDTDN